MKKSVLLSVRGLQSYMDQEPDTIELVTEGTMEKTCEGWRIVYEESALTGLEGVTTSFQVQPGKIVLTRTGKLNSQMIFQEGVSHDSLYQMDFGALMITVCATQVQYDLTEQGGTIDLVYGISIEHTQTGTIEYHLQITTR